MSVADQEPISLARVRDVWYQLSISDLAQYDKWLPCHVRGECCLYPDKKGMLSTIHCLILVFFPLLFLPALSSAAGNIWHQKAISNLISYYCVALLGELFQLLILALSQICSLFVPHIRVEIKDFKQECCSGGIFCQEKPQDTTFNIWNKIL